MKKLTTALLSLLSIFTCCADKPSAPRLPLSDISYTYGSQMIAFPVFSMRFFSANDSVFAIVFKIDQIQYSRYLIKQEGVMQRMKQIILDEKMYRYKSSYSNPHVLDGDGWSFNATFCDDVDDRHQHMEWISSGGSNKWPGGKGLKRIESAMKEAMTDAEFLYICDENGHEVSEAPAADDSVSEETSNE